MALESSIAVFSFNLVSGSPLVVHLPVGYEQMVPAGFHFWGEAFHGHDGPCGLELGFDDGSYHGSCAVDTGDFLSAFITSEGGASDSNSISSVRNTALNQYILAGFVSATAAGQFTISWSRWHSMYAGKRINVIAWGSPILAKAGKVTGTRIAPGFKPVLIGLIGSGKVAGTVNGPGAGMGIGWACDCHDGQVALAVDSAASANPSNDGSAMIVGKAMIKISLGPDGLQSQHNFTNWDATGADLNAAANSGGWQYMHYLALGGELAANITHFTQKTSGPGSQGVPILARRPKALIALSADKVAATTSTPNLRVSMGAAVAGVAQMANWAGEKDNMAPQAWGQYQGNKDDRLITIADPTAYYGTPAERAVASLVSVQSRQVNLNWSKADATATDIALVVMAERGSVPDPGPCGDEDEENTFDDCGCVGAPPDGPTLAIAEVDLPDRLSYHYGFKPGLLTATGEAVRNLSDPTGAPQTSSLDFSIFDRDGEWRARMADPDPAIAELKGLYVVLYGISDQQRRLEAPPALLFRGAIAEYKWATDLQLQITCENYLACLLEQTGDKEQLPRFTFTTDDFPNCRHDGIHPGCYEYQCLGGGAEGVDSIAVSGGNGVFPPGARFQFDSIGTEYSVVNGSGNDPETSLTFSPSLAEAIPDGANLDFIETDFDNPAAGKRVPFAYGYISDRFVDGGIDNGDGQAPLTYVGERLLADGYIWGEFVWTGHRCYSPGGRPIDMLYFFNNALGVSDLEGSPNTWMFEGVAYNPRPLDVEADVGGRIILPGWPGWVDLGLGTGPNGSYRIYNGHEYTVVYLRSLYRAIALEIMGPPANLGGVPFAASAYGWGDGAGNLLKKAGQVYKHVWQNYLAGAWHGGPTLNTPLFPDGVPTLDEASFALADAAAARRVPDGCEFNFIVGFGDEKISKTEMLRRLNVAFDVNSGENEELQFAIYMEEHDPDVALAGAETLDDVNDIHEDDHRLEMAFQADRVANAVRIKHTKDYMGRAESGWRFGGGNDVDSGIFTDEDGIRQQCVILAPELELYLIRGRNRSIDIPDYQVGTDWVEDMAARRLLRTATAPMTYTVPTGLRATGPGFRLGGDFYISHFRNIGGRTPRPVRIVGIRALPGTEQGGRLVTITAEDQARVLEASP